MSGAVKVFAARSPTPTDFWEIAKKSERILQAHVPRLLESLVTSLESIKFTDITSAMHHIVSATAVFRENIEGALNARHITLDTFTEELEGIFLAILNDLEKIPLPDEVPGRTERLQVVDRILDNITLEVVKLTTQRGIEEEVIMAYISALKLHVRTLIVVVGDINEQHPQLFSALVSSVIALIIPESWILRPFLRLFGFGPAAKDSAAAQLQRRLWGTAVEPNGLISLFQIPGTGETSKWAGLVIKVPLPVGSLFAQVGLLPHDDGRPLRDRRDYPKASRSAKL